jgi:hypothetical protein
MTSGGDDRFDRQVEDTLGALGRGRAAAPPPGAALERELASLAPVRTRAPRRQLAGIIGLSLLYASGLIAMIGVRRDLGGLPWPWLVGFAILWLASFGSVSWLVVVPARDAVMPRWRVAVLVAAAAAALLIASGIAMPRMVPGSSTVYQPSVPAFLSHAGCFRWGLAGAAIPVILAALAIRGSVPVGSRWAAAAIGAAGGALGGFVLHMHCPISERFHVGLVHGGVVVAAALVTALVARVAGSATHARGG